MKIVLPTDLSEFSEEHLPVIFRFLNHLQKTDLLVYLLSIAEFTIPKEVPEELKVYLPGLQQFQRGVIEHADAQLQKIIGIYGDEYELRPVVMEKRGTVGADIAAFAESNGADMIIMSSHCRRGLSRLFLGSVTEQTIQHSACPVLIIPPEESQVEAPEIFRMVVTCDLSEDSNAAFVVAKDLYQKMGIERAQLTVVHLCENLTRATYGLSLGVDPSEIAYEAEGAAQLQLEKFIERWFPGQPVMGVVLGAQQPAEEAFLEYLQGHNVDLVISAHKNAEGFVHSLFGGFTRTVSLRGMRKILIVPVKPGITP